MLLSLLLHICAYVTPEPQFPPLLSGVRGPEDLCKGFEELVVRRAGDFALLLSVEDRA